MPKITLKAARVNMDLSQSEAAAAIGVTRQTIQKWENGKTYPSVAQFAELCKLYQMPLDAIFLPIKSA